jgi:hypothetical protein
MSQLWQTYIKGTVNPPRIEERAVKTAVEDGEKNQSWSQLKCSSEEDEKRLMKSVKQKTDFSLYWRSCPSHISTDKMFSSSGKFSFLRWQEFASVGLFHKGSRQSNFFVIYSFLCQFLISSLLTEPNEKLISERSSHAHDYELNSMTAK